MGNGLLLVGLALLASAIGGQGKVVYDAGHRVATDSRFWPATLLFATLIVVHSVTTNKGVKSMIKAFIALIVVAFVFGIFGKEEKKP